MERYNSLSQGRSSLNSTKMTNPIAESTCINGGSTQTHFQWGSTRISPKNRRTSISCFSNTTSSPSVSKSVPRVHMSPNTSRIDPRMYADVQSKGLASRIVKYHDSNVRLNRSLSVNNLYNKPGQFPVVHLKKTEIPYKANRNQNLSVSRIAPPEKSMYNSMSTITRYGSVVSLQKSNEEISCENRPILHPPPTENEIAPTPSVLEVLKEISRKRINSDELDNTDGTKKYCNRELSEAAKSPPVATQTWSGVQHCSSTTVNAKRQREQLQNPQQQHQQHHLHRSPEHYQAVKKRMFSYNNDITSSLSSSLLSTSKRKINQSKILQNGFVAKGYVSTENAANSRLDELALCRAKQQCAELGFEKITQSLKPDPITPIPPTPLIQSKSDIGRNLGSPHLTSSQASLPMRTMSVPTFAAASGSKPKLTLFNKNYDEPITTTAVVERLDRPESDDDELRGIQFVKPKKSSSISVGNNLLIERTQKSKLALMLSGLKGELDHEDEDEVISTKKPINDFNHIEKITVAPSVTLSITDGPAMTAISSANSTSMATSANAVTTSDKSKIIGINTLISTKNTTPLKSATPTETFGGFQSTQTKITSPLTGLKLTPPSAAAATVLTTATKLTMNAAPISSASLITQANPAGGFSFGITSSKIATTTTTTATNFGSTSASATTSSPVLFASNTTTTVANTMFSLPSKTTVTSTSIPISSTPNLLISSTIASSIDSFTSTITKPPISSDIVKPKPLTFSAGASTSAEKTHGVMTPHTVSQVFGSMTNPLFSQATVATSVKSAAPPTFNFGASTIAQTTAVNNNKTGGFSFSSTSASTEQKQNSNTPFSFGSTIVTTSQNSISHTNPLPVVATMSFGSTAIAAPTNSSSMFEKHPNAPLLFGTSSISTAASTNSFSNTSTSTATTAAKTFSFGAPQKIQPTVETCSSGAAAQSTFSFQSPQGKPTSAITSPSAVGGFAFNTTPAAAQKLPTNLFATAKPSFNFGSGTSAQPNFATPSMFSSSTNNTSGSTFGSLIAPATSQPQKNHSNLFGSNSASSATQANEKTASEPVFSFSGANKSANNNTGSANSFMFGNNLATNETGSTPFTFGSANVGSSKSASTLPVNKVFSFGAPAQTVSSSASSNLFGNPTSGPSTNGGPSSLSNSTNLNTTFNFSSTQSDQKTNGNIFAAVSQNQNPAAGANLLNPGERPIRRATRRLHKP